MKSEKPEAIYLIARWNGNRLVYPTRLSIIPKNWNIKAQEIRNVIQEPNRDSFNRTLKDLKAAVSRLYALSIECQDPLTVEVLRDRLNEHTGRNDAPDKHFWGFLDNFITNAGKRTGRSGKLLAMPTIRKYKTTVSDLRAFEKETRRRIDFNIIDTDFYTDFKDYLTQVKKMKTNSVGKTIAILKVFLNEAAIAGIGGMNIERIKRNFKVISESVASVYLSESELEALYKLDLSENKRLDRIRDLFLIGCYTGLRVSDFTNIKIHNIKSGNLDLHETKTGERVVIPIHETVEMILQKYNGIPPPKISDQKLNEYVKELCKEAKISEQMEIQATKGGQRITEVFEKWQLVSSHTARRSFATNMYKAGIPAQTIMKITGHKKESTFLKYIKLSGSEHAEIMRTHWHTATEKKRQLTASK
ncbi:tyrosine-type recombinase/integrase [Flavitalea flava]